MTAYVLHTPDGTIVQFGYAPDPAEQARPGLTALEVAAEVLEGLDPARVHVVDGAVVDRPAPDTGPAWAQVRAQRNALLAASDWVRLRANDRGELMPTEWLTYRQALRDVTEQPDPFAIEWPTAPASG